MQVYSILLINELAAYIISMGSACHKKTIVWSLLVTTLTHKNIGRNRKQTQDAQVHLHSLLNIVLMDIR